MVTERLVAGSERFLGAVDSFRLGQDVTRAR
jgi:hypothetical protein